MFVKDSNGNLAIKPCSVVAILAVAIMILCLISAGSSQSTFVDQFSFASTITSIVLSVIAIWMSITGERGTIEIKDKILHASERLEKTTSNVEKINSNYQKEISDQITSLEYIQKKLDEIVLSFTDVKDEMSLTKEQVNHVANKIDDLGGMDIKDEIPFDLIVKLYSKSLKYWKNVGIKKLEIIVFQDIIELYLNKAPVKFGINQFKELANCKPEKFEGEYLDSMYGRIYLILSVLKKEDYSTFKKELTKFID